MKNLSGRNLFLRVSAWALFAACMGSASAAEANVNDYNLICVSRSASHAQVFFNNYSLAVGTRLSVDGGFLVDLETLLVQPVNGCRNCYDITAATRLTREHVYIAKVRTVGCAKSGCETADNLNYSIALYETLGDSQQQVTVVDRTACVANQPANPTSARRP